MENKRTTIQLYENTRKELCKLIAQLESQDGKKRSYDEGMLELMEFWRKGHPEPTSSSP
jgi:hypothetical protein